jgi:hypothetical protein
MGSGSFVKQIANLDKDNLGHLIPVMRNYCDDVTFSNENVLKVSTAAASLNSWIHGIYRYVLLKKALGGIG